jgi:hypothetical protein
MFQSQGQGDALSLERAANYTPLGSCCNGLAPELVGNLEHFTVRPCLSVLAYPSPAQPVQSAVGKARCSSIGGPR